MWLETLPALKLAMYQGELRAHAMQEMHQLYSDVCSIQLLMHKCMSACCSCTPPSEAHMQI